MPNPQQLTSEQAQQIANLPWAQDNPWSVSALQELATMSTSAFQAWMQRFGDGETHEALIEAFTSIAICDEGAASEIARMPFLDDAGVGAYFEASDGNILEGLGRVAKANPDGFAEMLSHPELQGGITDALTAPALLLILEQEDAAAATAIRGLPWVADGITYVDHDARPTADYVENETAYVIGFVERARRANKSFWAFLEIPWVRDGYQWTEYGVAINLDNLAHWDDESTARILKMPFLETLEGDELDVVYFLLEVAYRRSLQQLISSPKLEGGIRDGQLGTVALADIELRDPDAAAALNGLAWLQDGIEPSEQEALRSMASTAAGSDPLFRGLLAKSWVQDGLMRHELKVIRNLLFMASTPLDDTVRRANEATALRILDMPFLEDVETLDALATSSLEVLMFSDNEGALQQVLSLPELRDGITDDWTPLLAVMSLAERRPGLLGILFDPEQTPVEKRVITLPLAGRVTLYVIGPQGYAALSFTQPGSASLEPMDLLEHAVRTHEEFMGVPFPQRDLVMFVADVTDKGGGHFGSGLSISDSRSSAYTIAHETAHIWEGTPIWLARPSTWIREGLAQFLTFISERARAGTPLPEPRDSCSLANSISEVVRLGLDSDVIYRSSCNYVLGEGMFLELYNSLGDAAFRQGFSNLHLAGLEDTELRFPQGACAAIDAALCYFKVAFLSGLTPQQTAIAERIIDRRYYGASR